MAVFNLLVSTEGFITCPAESDWECVCVCVCVCNRALWGDDLIDIRRARS